MPPRSNGSAEEYPARSLSGTQIAATFALAALVVIARLRARHERQYVRLAVDAYRTDRASAASIASLFDTVQFLDGRETHADDGDGGDADLAGVGAQDGDPAF